MTPPGTLGLSPSIMQRARELSREEPPGSGIFRVKVIRDIVMAIDYEFAFVKSAEVGLSFVLIFSSLLEYYVPIHEKFKALIVPYDCYEPIRD
jgi:hypothetical protein